MKALAAAFNQEKALVGAFSVIVKTDCETDVNLEQSQRCDGELHNFGGWRISQTIISISQFKRFAKSSQSILRIGDYDAK